MEILNKDVRILLDFLPQFEISNSKWGEDFISRLKETTPPLEKDLTVSDKLDCDWEEQ